MEAQEPAESAAPMRSICGVYVEASGKTLTFAEAAREHLIQPDVALALLEAQAATGGITDPVAGRLISVTEALVAGLVGLEMKEKLLCAERAMKGFTDPYTGENISLYQAIQKELIGRDLGLHLLEAQLATGGVIEPTTGHRVPLQEAYARGYLDQGLSSSLSGPGNEVAKGFRDPNTDQKVTYMELIGRCVADPARGLLLLPLKISFTGLRGAVCSQELLDSGIIDSAIFEALRKGEMTAQEVSEMDSVRQSLSDTRSIAGVAVLPTGECKSVYQALAEHLLPPGTAERLLQAQAASGCLVDPAKNTTFTAAEAVRAGVVGPEFFEKLFAAERAVTGYKDPHTGETLSLFQALKKHLVPRNPGIFLLDAQLATGGIIDPHTHHRLPTQTALQRGLLDEETHRLLCNPSDATRGFFEPNSKKNLSYAELLLQCVTDPETGLCLLPLPEDHGRTHAFIDHNTKLVLKDTTVSAAPGRFRGEPVSLWKLLFSEYITGEQRRALIQQFSSGALSPQHMAEKVRLIAERNSADSPVTFEGLRESVTPAQLLSSEIISRDLFEKLTQGETVAKEVVSSGQVRGYLEGAASIAGLLLPDSQERMSIYQAKRKGLLYPGTSLVLLEAQAATGYIIDPVANRKYSVDEALRASVIGPDVYSKLLAAEKAVVGYRDPYTGNKISLFQAMKKDLIVKQHAIRLLEAQIATGGIIDPVNSHRLPVEVAYKRGFFDKKMNLILSDPSDDTKGFFDPNTHENLTYLQLKEKCVVEPSTGLCLLPLHSSKPRLVDDATKHTFRSAWIFVKYGRLQGQRVSLWDLLNSEYISEGKRREILKRYSQQKVTLEQIHLSLAEEVKKWACIEFPALRGKASAHQLMERGIIDRALFEEILEGTVSPEKVLRMDSVRKHLCGTGSIGGILLQPSNERVSLYEAVKRKLAAPGVLLPLLEAQAATGFLVDPENSRRLCLEDAVRKGLVGPELHMQLQRAEDAVTGYDDPFTGKKVSLFQAMKKGLLAVRQAIQLMDAQLATGGVIDPHSGHYVPLEFAQKKGYLDEEFRKLLSNPSGDTKAFHSLDGKEKVSYGQLLERCQKEEPSGIHLLPLSQRASPPYTEEQILQHFRETFGEDKGASLWDHLTSGYFTEEQKRDFFEKYSSGTLSLPQLLSLVQGLIQDLEMKAQTQVSFQGLRGAVPAVWLLDTGIISHETFAELAQGSRTAGEVAEKKSVKRYLLGTGSIAGVFIQSSKEKMNIYQAMQKNLLLPGVGARLLEAQAATGSITDPEANQQFGVEEAIQRGIVGEELTEKLLQAEKAVTGFPDPYSGKPISLFQAIRKELIPARVGIPLLEAQLATGGIIDPSHCHHLPLQAAYQRGLLDEAMHKTLSQDHEESQVFFDPNTQESLTYQKLKDRCIQDAETGLWLLPLSEEATFYGDQQAMELLKSVSVCVSVGRFKGHDVSLWDLLHSEYVPDGKRRELVIMYKEKEAELLQQMASAITKIIEETEQQGKTFTFKGLRKKVSASDLFRSQLIDMETLDDLRQGKRTTQEVSEMDSVRQYLEGCNFIAGVLVQPDHKKMSIYQAMRQGLLRPGAALVLLEAQAATGFLIDPVKNKKLSVEEAMAAGLIGREIYEKLLSAEKAVTGYTDPYTKGQISLFEAMNQELIVRSHGIRLLEAQIATGGIIDPIHSHRIPVEVAYQRGYFEEDLNRILLDPTDDTKGFFDPNTHENLTYLQLLERCIQDPETGLYMLQIVKRGQGYFYIDEATKEFLKAQPMQVLVGRYKGQAVSVWDLLCSPYVPEQRRKELVRQYKAEGLTLLELCKAITSAVEDTEKEAQKLKLKGPRGEVSAAELFNAEIIDRKTLDRLQQQPRALKQLSERDSVRRYLEGTGCIAGVSTADQGLQLPIYEAMRRGILSPEHALMLLEAQAATGLIADLLEKKALSVDQAVSAGLIGEEFHEKLLVAEKAVTGYGDPSTGNKLSLFQAMKRNLVEKGLALRLLEAQIATGGIVDPSHNHRIPVEVAYKRGCLDEDTFLLLSDGECATKGFIDPRTRERVTYGQLLLRCTRDAKTGLHLLPLRDSREYFCLEEQIKNSLSSTHINIGIGKYREQDRTLWELLSSDYVTEEKQKELIKKYKQEISGVLQYITSEILNMMNEKEKKRKDLWFQGLRKQVTASELVKADIISRETMENLKTGKQRPQDVAKMDSVRRYLEGTSCIAGVLVPCKTDPSRMEKMTIYQAIWKGVLRPGTALVLLEAQAATGFIIDPLENKKLSVSEALAAGLVGGEIQNKLLSAEKAVTGYTDPNNGKSISLWEAMKKELILKEHGIRLLEAQIATGGIIDPMQSHRLPVDVAYQRGYFDEEMNQTLSDPTDDFKGFFDPNTHENLTYMQLLQRCFPDGDTGLLMLHVMDKGVFSFHLSDSTRRSLQLAKTKIGVGLFQDQEVSLWDLLFSRYMPPSKRQELLMQYKAGSVTLEDMTQVLISTITEAEEKNTGTTRQREAPRVLETAPPNDVTAESNSEEPRLKTLRSTTISMPAGESQGQLVILWDLLFSHYISEEKRTELVDLYKSGLLSTERLRSILTMLVVKKEGTVRKLDVKVKGADEETGPGHKARRDSTPKSGNWERTLRSQLIQGPSGDQRLSAWDVLFSEHISEHEREELLSRFRKGSLHLTELTKIVTDRLLTIADRESHLPTTIQTQSSSSKAKGEDDEPEIDLGGKEESLKCRMVEVTGAEFNGRKVSVWELLHSKYIPEEKRRELLYLYKSGILTIDQMETVVTTIVNKTEEAEKREATEAPSHSGAWDDPLHNHTVVLNAGELQGQEISLWDLLFSPYVPERQREELLMKYQSGTLNVQDIIVTLSPLLTKQGANAPGEETMLSLQHNELESALRQLAIDVSTGEFQGSRRSAWELLFSKYVTADKRYDLLRKYQEGSVAPDELVQILVTQIEEMERKGKQLKFSGLRRQVTASELLDSQIINQDTFSKLTQGTKTVQEVTEMDLVKRYLEGTSCIAGVLVPCKTDPSRMEKMTIYQAIWKGVLRPGTALVLLEAQAATGFIIDPLENKKLSVSEAISAELVGVELREKLLSAERAVTGYTDPYSGNKISLFQAMKKGLIVRDHGIRLLEAQIATGGIIDPMQSHRLPVDVAYQRGYFDEEMNQTLSDPTDDSKGFFDPNTHENLTYMQLLQRCFPDGDTGLLMLHVMDKGVFSFHLSDSTRRSLQLAKTKIGVGLFQDQEVSLWDLLFSRYMPPSKRQELLMQYKAGSVTLEDMTQVLISIITEAEEKNTGTTRQREAPRVLETAPPNDVTAESNSEEPRLKTLRSTTISMPAGESQGQLVILWDLLFSHYISEEKRTELVDLYKSGLLSTERLRSILTMLVVKKEGTVRKLDVKVKGADEETGPGHKARRDSTPESGNWERTLRSQLIQGPSGDQRLSAWDVLFSEHISEHEREELLSRFRKGSLHLTELTKIVTDRLLTIADRESHLPTTIQTQSSSSKAKGEDDEPEIDLGGKEESLKCRMVEVTGAEFNGRKVSVWELLHSKYIPEEKRRELLYLYKSGILTIDQMETVVTTIVNKTEEAEKREASKSHLDSSMPGDERKEKISPDRVVSNESGIHQPSYYDLLHHTLHLENIDVTIHNLRSQKASVWDPFFSRCVSSIKDQEFLPSDKAATLSVKENLRNSSAIAETDKSSDKSSGREIITLQAGKYITTPKESEASQAEDHFPRQNALRSRVVNVPIDESHEKELSLWDILHSPYVPDKQKEELLQLYRSGDLTIDQLETVVTTIVNKTEEAEKREATEAPSHSGAWDDPLHNHTVVLNAGELQGQEISLWDLLFSPYVPERQREELLMKYQSGTLNVQDIIVTLSPLLTKQGANAPGEETMLSLQHNELESALRQLAIDVSMGEFQGSRRSAWELLFSKYVTADKRYDLLRKYQEGSVAPDELVQILVTQIEEMERKGKQLKFSGLRRQVTASELLDSQIINQDTFSKLTQGTKTVQEVTEMDLVKRYLEGTSCIAGVLVPCKTDPSRMEMMTIYQAIWKGVLRPGTALVLLEAQAATGFIIDPLENKKLSVSEAISAELVGVELREKLLSAERAVTGYTDPYSGNKISLFQAMKKGLIVRDHGIRLLEAQIATGGIIDPMQSHRLPVDVAYQRGYFDEEMNQTLSDPTDDSKGFFDPNTHENLTYMQLLQRCFPDGDTGLLMLHVMDKGVFSFHLSDSTRRSLQLAKTKIGVGLFQDQEVSLWDLLFSRYMPPSKRQELLMQYKAGSVTLEDMTQVLISTITEAEEKNTGTTRQREAPRVLETAPPNDVTAESNSEEPRLKTLRSTTISMPAGESQGQLVILWDLLFSHYISEEKRTELVDLYKSGLLSTERLRSILTMLVVKKEGTVRKLDVKVKGADEETGPGHKARRDSTPESGNWERTLRSQLIQGPSGDQRLSAWDVLFSEHISEHEREELLSRFRKGSLHLTELTKIVTDRLLTIADRESHLPTTIQTQSSSSKAKGEDDEPEIDLGGKEESLKCRMVEVTGAEFHGRKVSVWDLLHSKYIPEEKRRELLYLYKSGILTIDQMETVVTTIVNKTEEAEKREASKSHLDSSMPGDERKEKISPDRVVSNESGIHQPSYYDLLHHTLHLENIDVTIHNLRSQKASVWDPFFSRCVSSIKDQEFLPSDKAATLSVKENLRNSSAIAETDKSSDKSSGREIITLQAGKYITTPKESEASQAEDHFPRQNALRSRVVNVPIDESHEKELSLWDILHSPYVPDKQKEELLQLYRSGDLTIDQLETVVTNFIHKTSDKERPARGPSASSSPDGLTVEQRDSQARQLQLKKSLRTTLVPVTVGEYKGQKVCVLDLLFSRYVPQDTRQELLELYRAGSVPIEDMISTITNLMEEAESQREKRDRKKKVLCKKEGFVLE